MCKTEIWGKAIPKIPSNLAAMNEAPDKVVDSPKSTEVETPATLTTSLETKPLTPPDPYWI